MNHIELSDITINYFKRYFDILFEDIRNSAYIEADICNRNNDYNKDNPTFEKFNVHMSCDEVRSWESVQSLIQILVNVITC